MPQLNAQINLDLGQFVKSLKKALQAAQAAGVQIQKSFSGKGEFRELQQAGQKTAAKIESIFQDIDLINEQRAAKDFDKIVDSAKKSGKKTGAAFGKEAGGGVKSFMADVGSFAVGGGLVAAGGALLSAGKQAFNGYVELDRQVQNIGTLGVKNFEEFAGLAQEMAKQVPQSAEELAEGSYQAISAGIQGSNKEIADFTLKAGKVATAGLASTNEAVNGLTSVMNAYGLSVKDTDEVSNTFFAGIKAGKTTFSELNAGLAQVLPTAAASGVKFDELTAVISQMTALGVPTSQAATKINAALVELQKPGADLAKVMSGVTVTIGGVKQKLSGSNIAEVLKQQGYVKTLQQIKQSADSMGVSLTQSFGSSEAASAALLVTGNNAARALETIDNVRKDIKSGAADAAYKVASQGIGVQMGILKNNVQNLFNGLFGAIAPMLNGIIQPITEILSDGALIGLFKTLGKTIGELLSGAMKLLKPIFAVVSALMPVISKLLDAAMKILNPFISLVEKILTPLADLITPIVDVVLELVNAFMEALLPVIEELLNEMGGSFQETIKSVAGYIKMLAGVISWLIQNALKPYLSFVSKLWVQLAKLANIIVKTVMGAIKELYDGIVSVTSAIGSFFGLIDEEEKKKPMETTAKGMKKAKKETDLATDSAKKLKDQLEKNKISEEELAKIEQARLAKAKAATEEYRKARVKLRKELERYLKLQDQEQSGLQIEADNKAYDLYLQKMKQLKDQIAEQDIPEDEKVRLEFEASVEINKLEYDQSVILINRKYDEEIKKAEETARRVLQNELLTKSEKETIERELTETVTKLNKNRLAEIKIQESKFNEEKRVSELKYEKDLNAAKISELERQLAFEEGKTRASVLRIAKMKRELLNLELPPEPVTGEQTPEQEKRSGEREEKLKVINREEKIGILKTDTNLPEWQNELNSQQEALKDQYEDDIKAAKDNTAKKLEIMKTYMDKVYKLNYDSMMEHNQMQGALVKFTEGMQKRLTQSVDKEKQKQIKNDIKSLKQEERELKKARAKGEISYEEFAEKTNAINQKIRDKETELQESQISVQEVLQSGAIESLKYVNGIFKKNLDDSIAGYHSGLNELTDVTASAALAVTGTFAMALAQGESAGDQFLLLALGMLEKMIPIFVAEIFGVTASSPANISTMGAWGFAAFAGLTATLQGLVSYAKSQIGAETGYLPGVKGYQSQPGRTDTKNVWVSPKEAIVPEDITSREMPLLTALMQGKTSQEYFKEIGYDFNREIDFSYLLPGWAKEQIEFVQQISPKVVEKIQQSGIVDIARKVSTSALPALRQMQQLQPDTKTIEMVKKYQAATVERQRLHDIVDTMPEIRMNPIVNDATQWSRGTDRELNKKIDNVADKVVDLKNMFLENWKLNKFKKDDKVKFELKGKDLHAAMKKAQREHFQRHAT